LVLVAALAAAAFDHQGPIDLVSASFDERHEGTGVRLLVSADFNRVADGPVPIHVRVTLPFGAGAVSSCDGATGADVLQCSITRATSNAVTDDLVIDGLMSSRRSLTAGGSTIWADVFLDTLGVGWRGTHTKVLVNLPSVYSTTTSTAVPLSVTYRIPEIDRLSWAGMQPTICCSENDAHWSYPGNTLSPPPGPLIALKEGVPETDSSRTFLAGALFGLGSAALLEALGELATQLDRRPAASRRKLADAPTPVGPLRRQR
jgi:hypothetical protein